jgi:hypothetical protein
MINDWLYRPDRMVLREQALSTLLKKYGGYLTEHGLPMYSTESIYAAAHDWISAGNKDMDGLPSFYENFHTRYQERL